MSQKLVKAWIPVLLFTVLWADLIRQLGYHWSTNPQYAFGWSVPFLSAFLFWEAWIARPAPAAPPRSRWGFLPIALCAFCILPSRLFFEATPDWRLPLWVSAVAVAGITMGWFWLVGGRPWLRHFAFPAAFILVAIPWPVKLEQPVIEGLTSAVTSLTVHGLNICSVPAVGRGNLIEISSGVVGVEEACSGIRSFQSALMASLFLGQFFFFRWPVRFLLVGVGAVVAFISNVFRAGILTAIADKEGIPELEKWHDPAGYTILLVCFGVLTAIALYLKPKLPPPHRKDASPEPLAAPRALLVGVLLWVLFAIGGTEAWYRSGTHVPAPWWRVELPTGKTGFAQLPLSTEIQAMKPDEAKGARWWEEDESKFTLYFFRWLPGPATSRMLARFHRPEICLPAAGLTFVRESDLETLKIGDIQLPFRTYRFEAKGKPMHVFFCVWEDEQGAGPVEVAWTPESRLQAVLMRRRKLGQQVLEVGITGEATDEQAREEFRRVIAPLIRPDSLLNAVRPAGTGPA